MSDTTTMKVNRLGLLSVMAVLALDTSSRSSFGLVVIVLFFRGWLAMGHLMPRMRMLGDNHLKKVRCLTRTGSWAW